MARGQTSERDAAGTPARPVKDRRMQAPAELDEKFGAHTVSEGYTQGLVKTEDVPALLQAFGLIAPREIQFPWQHMKRQQGELWGLRIEAAQHHSVAGELVQAHVWSFTNHTSESVVAAPQSHVG